METWLEPQNTPFQCPLDDLGKGSLERASGISRGYNREGKDSSPPTDTTSVPNIIVFGETGTGKSSLINMLAGVDATAVSNRAVGGTYSSQRHDIILRDKPYRIWDTAGLNEGEHGTVPAEDALKNLSTLVGAMSEGVNLLVYCIRGARFRDILKFNYDIFHKIICQEQVTIVVVVTGLENEPRMESWWDENVAEFERYGLKFDGHACVTATRGKNGMFEEEFTESRKAVEELIVAHSGTPLAACQGVDGQTRMRDIVKKMEEYKYKYNRRVEGTSTEDNTFKLPPGVGGILAICWTWVKKQAEEIVGTFRRKRSQPATLGLEA